MYDTDVKSGCERKVKRRLQHKFQDVIIPNRGKESCIINIFKGTRILLHKK
jgi:hypothetical protein